MVARVGAEPRDLRRRLAQLAPERGHGQGRDQRQEPARSILVGIDRGRRTPDELLALLVVQHLQQHPFAVRNRARRAQRLRVLQIARIALVAHRGAHRWRSGPALRRAPDRPAEIGQQHAQRAFRLVAADPRLLRPAPRRSRRRQPIESRRTDSRAHLHSCNGVVTPERRVRLPVTASRRECPRRPELGPRSLVRFSWGVPPTARPRVPCRIPRSGLSGCASRR